MKDFFKRVLFSNVSEHASSTTVSANSTHTHTQLTKNRKGTTKCLFSFFKKIGGEKHLG